MFWSVTVPDDVEIDLNQGSGEIVVLADATTLDWEKMFIGETIKYPNIYVPVL